jgi:hypothetical protein
VVRRRSSYSARLVLVASVSTFACCCALSPHVKCTSWRSRAELLCSSSAVSKPCCSCVSCAVAAAAAASCSLPVTAFRAAENSRYPLCGQHDLIFLLHATAAAAAAAARCTRPVTASWARRSSLSFDHQDPSTSCWVSIYVYILS